MGDGSPERGGPVQDVEVFVAAPAVVRDTSVPIPIAVRVADTTEQGADVFVHSVDIRRSSGTETIPLGRTVAPMGSLISRLRGPQGRLVAERPGLGDAIRESIVGLDLETGVTDLVRDTDEAGPGKVEVAVRLRRRGTEEVVRRETSVKIAPALRRSPGWIAGDAHVHTCYSAEASCPWTPRWRAHQARSAGLDFIVLTDHADQIDATEYDSVHRECEAAAAEFGLVVAHGEELGWNDGHYLAYGLGSYVPQGSPREAVRAVAATGGFGYVAHPFGGGSPWRWDVGGFTGMEVVGSWPLVSPRAKALARLDRQGAAGRGWAPLSNSDDHVGFGLGANVTWVRVDGAPSPEALFAGMRSGRTVAGDGPLLLLSVGGATIGDRAEVKAGRTMTVECSWPAGTSFSKLDIVANGTRSASAVSDAENAAGAASRDVTMTKSGYVRAEADGAQGFAVTGPVLVRVRR